MVSGRANEEVMALLIRPYEGQVAMAAINGPQSVVISGQDDAIQAICATLDGLGVKSKKLNVSHAFHSPLMKPMLASFSQVAQQVTYSEPQIKLISNVTGQLANHEACPEELRITTAEYWVRHVRQPVRFAQGCECLERQGANLFIEIGPNPVLLGMGRNCLPEHAGLWLPSVRPDKDWQQLLTSLRELYLHDVPIDWVGVDLGYTRRRVPLPTYPWQRERYWIEPSKKTITTNNSNHGQRVHPLIGQRLHVAGIEDILFQSQISKDAPAWLQDHRIFDAIIVLGGTYFEMALAAGSTLAGSGTLWLKDVIIQQALLLPENGESKTLQLSIETTKPVTGQDTVTYPFQILSLALSGYTDAQWTCHVSGLLSVQKKQSCICACGHISRYFVSQHMFDHIAGTMYRGNSGLTTL
jgi:acyl transferase domain-containing protein